MEPTSERLALTARWRLIGRWAITFAALGAATVGMYVVRHSLDKAHVALVYLLIVLGASAAGGRALGLTVASLAFFCFDFFFLAPFQTLTIQNPLDWLVLVTFLATSVVAAQLLFRANVTADEAMARAVEVDRLAALGAETLNAADADEALRAIADVIRTSVAADECDIFLHGVDGRIVRVAHEHGRGEPSAQSASSSSERGSIAEVDARQDTSGSLVEWILEHGSSAVELTDGTVRVAHEFPDDDAASREQREQREQRWGAQRETVAAVRAVTRSEDRRSAASLRNIIALQPTSTALANSPAVRALALPLRVRANVVGVLRISRAVELALTPEQARLLIALAYYAALGAERARLVAAAERAEAERRLESLRSALFTAVSHDLRTPLTTIKGLASEIHRDFRLEGAAVIESEADRMDALVSDLLDLSRIHAGAVRPAVAVNTVDDLLGAALRGASGVLAERHIDVDLPKEALLAGYFDFTQTLRIVVNLLDNAAKYSPKDSAIAIRVLQTRADDRIRIEVMDRGAGVAESERARIFAPFYRPPGVPPDVRGHGLGLSIAKGLAEAQGGSVQYSPRPGGGSIFTLDLPAANIAMLEAEARESPVD